MDCWSNGNTQGTENYCRGKKQMSLKEIKNEDLIFSNDTVLMQIHGFGLSSLNHAKKPKNKTNFV